MRSVLHISATDRTGGAAIAAQRLHIGLNRIGVASAMAVGRKVTDDPAVHLFGRPPQRFHKRLPGKLTAWRKAREHRRHRHTRLPTLEIFSDDRVDGLDPLSTRLPDADVYDIHWAAGFLDWRRVLARIGARPLVFTLHDMNNFTGGCHYALGCEKFTAHCGACPQLGSSNPADVSRGIHARKAAALAGRAPERTRIVAPSRWLAAEAARSTLFSRFTIDVVPYGVDTEVFCPRDRRMAREVLGLPQDRPVVMFVAESLANHRKGFDLLLAALSDLPAGADVTLAAVGAARGALPGGAVSIGRIENERLMSLAYSAADVFVLPTRADNLPNVFLEAMACGTPVVSFDVGGVPDLVRPGKTGLLAPPENIEALRKAICTLIIDEGARATMSERCRALAEAHSLEVQAERYRDIYDELCDRAAVDAT